MAHPVDIHVGKQLRLQRIIMGLSQEALAKAVGITFQQVQKYERGINRMSASRLWDFANVLGVPVSYFFDGYGIEGGESEAMEYLTADRGGVSEGDSDDFAHEQVFTRETLELMRCYHRVKDPSVKRRFVDLLRAVSDDKLMVEEDVEAASNA